MQDAAVARTAISGIVRVLRQHAAVVDENTFGVEGSHISVSICGRSAVKIHPTPPSFGLDATGMCADPEAFALAVKIFADRYRYYGTQQYCNNKAIFRHSPSARRLVVLSTTC